MILTLDLVPSSSHYNNVRSNVSTSTWDVIRKKCYAQANHRCEICGSTGFKQGFKHKVECHEIWEYDELKNIQRLKGFIALCPMCHKVKHYGLAQINGEEKMVLEHFRKVNKMTNKDSALYIGNEFLKWGERSKKTWTLDITHLDEFNKDDFNKFMKKKF